MARTLFDYPNVVGFGTGFKATEGRVVARLARVVLVARKLEPAALRAQDFIPLEHDGMPTDVVEVGRLRALQARTDRWRPAPGGVSIGHGDVTAGTLGCIVRDQVGGGPLILSNNHVLANSNAGEEGDPIYQPGRYDGGTEAIARLLRWVPIVFTEEPGECPLAKGAAAIANAAAALLGSNHRLQSVRRQAATNLFDAAVARPLSDDLVKEDILGLSQPTQLMLVIPLEEELWKSGRTTGLTVGRAHVVDATVDVDYGAGRTARFEGQVVAGPMSQGGDSGSAVLDTGYRLAGLLFAGSDQATIISPIGPVMAELDLRL